MLKGISNDHFLLSLGKNPKLYSVLLKHAACPDMAPANSFQQGAVKDEGRFAHVCSLQKPRHVFLTVARGNAHRAILPAVFVLDGRSRRRLPLSDRVL
jgi:hypothetical protein